MRRTSPSCGTLLVHVVLVCSSLLATAATLAAQTSTASIIGTVTDESGAVLPGITVTATSPALQVPQVVTVTDAAGEYRLTPLPIGMYSVRYELSGFQTVVRTDVRLTIGFVATLDVAMNIGSFEESISVSGQSPVVDVTSATSRVQFLRETLEELPTTRNGILSLLIQAPGVRPTSSTLDVGGSQFGTQPQYNNFGRKGDQWVMMDGVLTTSANGSPEGVYWDFSSFEEAAISTVGAGAEMPGSGVWLNSIVKSGGNSFHGGGSWQQTGPWAQSNNIDDRLAARGVTGGNKLLGRYDVAGDLGGRLIRDKLWFYSNFRAANDDQQVIGAFKPDGTPVNAPQVQRFWNAKLSYQLGPSHKLIGLYSPNMKDQFSGPSALSSWETRTLRYQSGYIDKGEWQGLFGNSLAVSAHYGYYIYNSPCCPDDGLSAGAWGRRHIEEVLRRDAAGKIATFGNVATFDIVTQRSTGDSTFLATVVAKQYRHQVHAGLSWYKSDLFHGNHDIKAGFDYTPGTYDWEYFSRGISGDYQLVFRNSVPFQLNTFNVPLRTLNKAVYTGAFVEDNWTMGRLTLALGLRYDRHDGYVPEQSRPAGTFAAAATYPRVQFPIWNALAPRLHFAYDLTGRGKTAVKGGWGRFNKMRFTREIRPANINERAQTFYTWHDLNGNSAYDAGEVNLDPNGPDFVATQGGGLGGGALVVPYSDEQQPKVDELSLSIEHELMANFSVRVSGVYTRESNLRRLVGLSRPYESYSIPVTNSDPGPDGRRGTADDPGTLVTYYEYPEALRGAAFETLTPVNDPDLTNTYRAFELTAQKRSSNNWQLLGTFGSGWRNQPVGVSGVGEGVPPDLVPLTPNAEIFAARRVRDWYWKLGGSYRFARLDLLASANAMGVNGEPYARTVSFTGGRTITSITLPVEPFGARHYPHIYLLDLRFEKALRIVGSHRVSARVDLFNALNNNVVISQSTQSGPNFERPLRILPARIAVFGVTYSF